jgi:syntaxin 1B/2/3
MDKARMTIYKLVNETKSMKGPLVATRTAQQNSLLRSLQDVAQEYQKVQETYKSKYKAKIERQIRIAQPDAAQEEIDEVVRTGNTSIFASSMLSTGIVDQQRVLGEIQNRQKDIQQIENSINELATLFQDMQMLISVILFYIRSSRSRSISWTHIWKRHMLTFRKEAKKSQKQLNIE